MNYLNILKQAHKKGLIALKDCVPTPVAFVSADLDDKPLSTPEIELGGNCGGAYITGLHGKDPLVSWLKKNAEAVKGICTLSKGVYKGYDLYLDKEYHGQSHERHTAFANAFAEVLKSNGIKCGVRDYLT